MIHSILEWLGLVQKKADIAVYGCDVAEITTLVHTLKNGQYSPCAMPSIYPFNEEITIGDVTFTAYVPSGNDGARRMYLDLLDYADGIVYLISSLDLTRLSLSKRELHDIIANEAATKPILVLVSQPDDSNISKETALSEELGLEDILAKDAGRVALFVYSLSSTELRGYEEGFRWLLNHI